MLRRLLGLSVLVLMVALVCPLPSSAQKGNKKAPPTPIADVDGGQLPPGEYVGKLLSTPLPNGSFMLQVEYKHMALKPNAKLPNQNSQATQQYQRDLQHIQRLQQQMHSARNPQQAAQHMHQLQQAMMQLQQHQITQQLKQQGQTGNLFQVVTEKKTVDFHVGDEVTVRLLNLPPEYDDKGKLKPPPSPGSEEYKKLKGSNTKLPGFEAKPEDLKVGATVKVVQVKPKPPTPVKSEAENKLTTKEKEKELTKEEKEALAKEAKEAKEAAAKEAKEAAANAPKVIVSTILILGDDPNAASTVGGNKKPGQ